MKRHLAGSLLLMVLFLPAMAQIQDEEPQLAEFQPQARSEQKSNSGDAGSLNPDFSGIHGFDLQDRGLAYEEFAWKHPADIQRSQPEAESPATWRLIRSRGLRQRRSFEFAPAVFPWLMMFTLTPEVRGNLGLDWDRSRK